MGLDLISMPANDGYVITNLSYVRKLRIILFVRPGAPSLDQRGQYLKGSIGIK